VLSNSSDKEVRVASDPFKTLLCSIHCISLLAAVGVCALSATKVSHADEPAAPRISTVDWAQEKCDYLIAKNEDGYTIVSILSPGKFTAGDVLEGDIHSVGYIRRIVKQGSGDVIMMRGEKYGIKRKVAVKTVREWSRYCKPEDE
jgi:hypothetical protein